MRTLLNRPVFDRDEYFESSARMIRWIVLGLVLITYPFDSSRGLVIFTMVTIVAIYNALRYLPETVTVSFFKSRINGLAVDHIFVVALVVLTGGLASPYYPLFFLLIIATIASYGIAGFAFSLSSQVVITLVLLSVELSPEPATADFQFIIKLVLLIIFSLVAEQSVRSRDEEYLLESRFTHRIENERQRLLSLINSLSNAVLAVDEKGKIYLYNAAALELLNTNRDIIGESINELLPLHNVHGTPINLIHLITDHDRSINRQDLYYSPSDGSKMILDLTVSPVHVFGTGQENWGGYMAVFRDITKQKSLDQERDEFISVTSHELRTPLAIAEANLSTALLPGFSKMDPKAKELVEQAHHNIVFLSQLIADLATLSRAERGDLKLKHTLVNVNELFETLKHSYGPEAEAKGLTFTTHIDPAVGNVYTSQHELEEIMQNFITNALKYTKTGSITVSAEQTEAGTDLTVRDTGIGISASDKTKVFSKFYRSEDYRTRQTGGTGLGLYITRKLGDKLGVKIYFTSKLNHGSTFHVLIPSLPKEKA
jgi:two-component system, OmpR family, phosphate regulon sensor histidine kinase PhoR